MINYFYRRLQTQLQSVKKSKKRTPPQGFPFITEKEILVNRNQRFMQKKFNEHA